MALRVFGIVPNDVDEVCFADEHARLTSASVELPAGEMRLAPLLADFMTVGRRQHLSFPRELGVLVKTVVMWEGGAARLDPIFALLRLARQLLWARF